MSTWRARYSRSPAKPRPSTKTTQRESSGRSPPAAPPGQVGNRGRQQQDDRHVERGLLAVVHRAQCRSQRLPAGGRTPSCLQIVLATPVPSCGHPTSASRRAYAASTARRAAVWRASYLADSYRVAHAAGSASSSSTSRARPRPLRPRSSAFCWSLRRFFDGPLGLALAAFGFARPPRGRGAVGGRVGARSSAADALRPDRRPRGAAPRPRRWWSSTHPCRGRRPRPALLAHPHVLRPAALVAAQRAALDRHRAGAYGVEQGAVVGDEQHRALERLQRVLQRLAALDVEVVGRLVEDQHVGAAADEDRERQSAALAAGEARERLFGLLAGEQEPAEQRARLVGRQPGGALGGIEYALARRAAGAELLRVLGEVADLHVVPGAELPRRQRPLPRERLDHRRLAACRWGRRARRARRAPATARRARAARSAARPTSTRPSLSSKITLPERSGALNANSKPCAVASGRARSARSSPVSSRATAPVWPLWPCSGSAR